jgi:nitroimidazol reductase NimA-like FMN-containing flavoprotein (pyridoxamine 5'-phosphate oxidase superfamily)
VVSDRAQPEPARQLSAAEIEEVLDLAIPAHLGTISARGFPRISAIWFLYEDGVFYMTSVTGKRHLRDLARDPRATVWVDTEGPPPERSNRQVGGRGMARVYRDEDGEWTRRITLKYVLGPEGETKAAFRAAMDRWVIAVKPERLIAIGA